MKDYGRYNSTVKTVQDMAVQIKNGYHISAEDRGVILYAIRDLCYMYDESKGGYTLMDKLDKTLNELLEED